MLFWIIYLVMALITARCFFLWLDEEPANPGEVFAAVFSCSFVGMYWPIIWLGRFITRGFSNPFKP